MIPTIGIMVAAYIALRCVEIATKAQSSYENGFGASVTRIFAVLVFVFALACGFDLMMAGTKATGVNLP